MMCTMWYISSSLRKRLKKQGIIVYNRQFFILTSKHHLPSAEREQIINFTVNYKRYNKLLRIEKINQHSLITNQPILTIEKIVVMLTYVNFRRRSKWKNQLKVNINIHQHKIRTFPKCSITYHLINYCNSFQLYSISWRRCSNQFL